MRHLKRTAKLGRTGQHRNRMLANLVCSLIKHRRVITTLEKAKAARSVAEKMITLGKAGSLHQRRLAAARLHQDEAAVKILFNDIAPTQKERRGGYTRIVRLGSAGQTPPNGPPRIRGCPGPGNPAGNVQNPGRRVKRTEKTENPRKRRKSPRPYARTA